MHISTYKIHFHQVTTHLIRLKALSGSTMYLLFTTAAIPSLLLAELLANLYGLVLLGHRQRDSH